VIYICCQLKVKEVELLLQYLLMKGTHKFIVLAVTNPLQGVAFCAVHTDESKIKAHDSSQSYKGVLKWFFFLALTIFQANEKNSV
jgi:hypothetical protein